MTNPPSFLLAFCMCLLLSHLLAHGIAALPGAPGGRMFFAFGGKLKKHSSFILGKLLDTRLCWSIRVTWLSLVTCNV